MAAGTAGALVFRLPERGRAVPAPRDRGFAMWRAAIWAAATVGMLALATTALNLVPGAADEIVMASACTLTGILGHLAPRSA